MAVVGIAGQWDFDEGEGTRVEDASPHGNAGVVRPGITWSSGRRGHALRFDGNSWVEVPHSGSLSIASGITVAAWIRPERFVDNDVIVAKTDYAREYLLYAAGYGKLIGRVRNGGWNAQDVVSAANVLKPGVWQHIAFTWSTRSARLYHNGTMVGEAQTQQPVIGANTAPVRIGGGAHSGGFNGLIDEVSIHIGALGPADIRALYE